MKKLLSIILSTFLIIYSFTGCVGITNYITKTNEKIKIGVSIANFDDKFWSYLLKGMQSYVNSLNDVEVIYADAKSDSNTQLSQVENFISQKVDVIVVTPVDRDSSKPITDAAKAAGIPIIGANDEFENQNDAESFIGSDRKQSGILEMEYMAKKINYKGNVAIMMGPIGNEAQRLRTQGFHEVIEKYPEIKIVAEQSAEWDRTKGMALMESWLESEKDIDVVACENDEMAIGALKSIEAAGKLEKIIVGGIDGIPDSLEYVKNGKLAITVSPAAMEQGKVIIQTAVKVAKNETVEKAIYFPCELVTSENVDKYIKKWEDIE